MELKTKVVSALRWSAGLKLVGQLLNWGMTLFVVRLLSPEDYGLMALATVFIGILMLVNELGIGPALIQKKEISKEVLAQGFGIVLLTNIIFSLSIVFCAPFIARYFEEPALVDIIQVLAAGFMLGAFVVVPEACLVRDLDFKRKSIVELVANCAGGVATLVFAYSGFAVWSLVWGFLTTLVLRVIGLNIVSPVQTWPRFSFKGAKELMSFGGFITLDRLVWFFYSRADTFIVGKLLGTGVLGIYSVALHIASLPMQKINGVLNEIAFPAFASIQADGDKIRDYLLKAIRLIGFFAFPVFWGLAAVAPVFVDIVLGSNWEAAKFPLATLSLVMPLRMIANLYASTLQGIGKIGMSVAISLITAIVMVAGYVVGTHWGLRGVCLSWLITVPIVAILIAMVSKPYVGFGLWALCKELFVPVCAAGLMFLTVLNSTSMLNEKLIPVVVLGIQAALGGFIYVGVTWLFSRDRYHEMLSLRNQA